MDNLSLIISYTLVYTCVLGVVALGGMFSERSGVINLGLEGTMVMGALGGALALRYIPVSAGGFVVVVIPIIVSMVVGAIYSLLLAVASVTFKADQTITGTALNILAPALATVIVKAITLKEEGKATPYLYYVDSHDFYTFNIFGIEINWFILITIVLIVLAYFILYKTRFGMRLMACGEHPSAADSVGINVQKMRYTGVIISGILGGIGGFAYIASKTTSWPFNVGVAGFGFLALAVMIFGQWKPIRIFLSGLLFGFFLTVAQVYNVIPGLKELSINPQWYKIIPYVVCLIVLAFTSKTSKAPKAEGIPYDKARR